MPEKASKYNETEVFLDGNCVLEHGDCLERMHGIEDESVDLILCDLPYGLTPNHWDCTIDEKRLWGEYRRIIKEHGAIILFGAGRFTASLIVSAGKLYRYSLVWQKTSPVGYLNAKRMPMRGHEDIVVCYKHLPTYNPQITHGHPRKVSTVEHKRNSVITTNYRKHDAHTYDSTDRYPTSVLTFATDKQKEALHPTQKPVALLEWLIRSYTNEGELVLDNCMGSGSTGVAALNTGRKFIGMESDPKYYDIAVERIVRTIEKNSMPAAE